MKRLLTAGIFGTILGIVGAGTANASIVSSGFLDEKLTEMTNATTLQLDNKANQSDLTALSNKIGTLPDGLTVANLYDGWTIPNGEYINGLSAIAYADFTTYDRLNDILNTKRKTESGGYLNMLARLFSEEGYYQAENSVLAPFWYLTKQALRVGEIPHGKTVAGMISETDAKIGTLPDGITVQDMYEGWTDSNKITYSGLNTISRELAYILDICDASNLHSLFLKGGTLTIPGFSTNTILPYPELSYGVSKIGTLPDGITVQGMYEGWTDSNNGTTYLGVKDLNTKIGTLPDGITVQGMYEGWTDSNNGTTYLGVKDLNTKIGTLPSGNFREFPGYELLFPWLNQPYTYPTSLAELINAIYGNSETGQMGLLEGIVAGFEIDTNGDGIVDSNVGTLSNFWLAKNANDLATANATKIGTVPDGKNLAGMISETDAKIGDLPTEYATVGAALTAIKGIAEDAKAAALAAIPDPKQEGSSGKFVLTVDIVGDNATYRWEKIDREGETTTTE